MRAPPASKPKATAAAQTPSATHASPRPGVVDAPPRVRALGAAGKALNARPAVVALREQEQGLNARPAAARPNRTGLPDALKAGVEAMSGLSMDDVRVHRNSARPARLNAKAYAQGSDIHLAPGQDRHLPHEAWHVVQQRQGRVRPTVQLKGGVPVNTDRLLEREADVMGAAAVAAGQQSGRGRGDDLQTPKPAGSKPPLQGEFTSIAEARHAAGDSEAAPRLRVQAEAHLRREGPAATAEIQTLVAQGEFGQALTRATALAGLPTGQYTVRPTADYASVVGDAEVLRGTPSGVTVTEHDRPVIYIHQDNIRKWVGEGDIGNLLSTIRHEAKHADQNLRPGARKGTDEREFEAYAAEITHTQELFASGEDWLMPSSAHLAESFAKATEHYNDLAEPKPANLAPIKAKIDELYPKLQKVLEQNDEESGRVKRIADATRAALRNYIDNPETYPSRAFNEYLKIPRQFRAKLNAEFDPLFDRAEQVRNRMRLTNADLKAGSDAK